VKSVLGGVTTQTPTTWYNVSGTTPTKHILLPDGEMLATVEGSNASATPSYIHTDHLTGSALSTNASGSQTQLLHLGSSLQSSLIQILLNFLPVGLRSISLFKRES